MIPLFIMHGERAKRAKSFGIMKLTACFHNLSTGNPQLLWKSGGSPGLAASAFGRGPVETDPDTPRDGTLLRLARVHFQDVPGGIPGAYVPFVMRARPPVNMDDLVPSVDEDEVKGDVRVFHPEILHVVAVMKEKHTRAPAQGCSEHQPLRLLLGRHRRLRLKTAEFAVFRIEENDADDGKVRC